MTDMNEFSHQLGRLEASQESTLALVKDMHRELQAVPMLRQHIREMRPIVADYSRMKQRAVGIIFGISLAAGTLGSAIKDALFQTWKS